MHVINAANVNDAYVMGLRWLTGHGVRQDSRNGPVLVAPEPVTTRYHNPRQRVLFQPQRDANPFFHLFEALWMLDGRNDVKTLAHFLPRMSSFSDDGKTFHGAYGNRWRYWQGGEFSLDQLNCIVNMLKNNPFDRRAVLSMWDPRRDLGTPSLDIPCNDLVKFRVRDGVLDMYVFCRSNDIVYGCYGANAVHFAFLQEYMALRIGVGIGVYEQISADFHAYLREPYALATYYPFREDAPVDPYHRLSLETRKLIDLDLGGAECFDAELKDCMNLVQTNRLASDNLYGYRNTFFATVVQPMYRAHRLYRGGDPEAGAAFLEHAMVRTPRLDWLMAGRQWLLRRKTRANQTDSAIMADLQDKADAQRRMNKLEQN